MANLVILEGLSRTGKTSIATHLSNKGFHFISIKNKMPESINLPDFYHGIHVMANQFYRTLRNESFVVDRSFISELVYSEFFKRKTFITEEIISEILSNNFILVYLTTSYENYLKRVPKDRIVYSKKDFDKQRELFDSWIDTYKKRYSSIECQRFIQIDTDLVSIEECVKIVEKQKNILYEN